MSIPDQDVRQILDPPSTLRHSQAKPYRDFKYCTLSMAARYATPSRKMLSPTSILAHFPAPLDAHPRVGGGIGMSRSKFMSPSYYYHNNNTVFIPTVKPFLPTPFRRLCRRPSDAPIPTPFRHPSDISSSDPPRTPPSARGRARGEGYAWASPSPIESRCR